MRNRIHGRGVFTAGYNGVFGDENADETLRPQREQGVRPEKMINQP